MGMLVRPLGLFSYAPSTFQRLMKQIFGDQSVQFLPLYLDDFYIKLKEQKYYFFNLRSETWAM